MKRSPLRRKTPLRRGGFLPRRTQIRAVLHKRRPLLAERRTFVASFLADNPYCQRCGSRAVDVHEPLRRSQGGSIVDPANAIPTCRACHDWIHDHPKRAREAGLLRSPETLREVGL